MLSKKGLSSRANNDSCSGGGGSVGGDGAAGPRSARPSVDPELVIRMLLAGYCYGIRHERQLCLEVALHFAYR
jgi:transposase